MTYKIVRLEAENIKRLQAVDITPDPQQPLVIIGGRNAQGKSSVIDAIAMVLGGGNEIPAEPVRRGSQKAHSLLDLGELVAERKFTAGGGTSLIVKNKDGERQSSPQSILDKLCASIAFDPLEFANDEAKQSERLRRLVGLDFTEHDAKAKALYEERTDQNRRLRDAQGELRGLALHPGVVAVDVASTLAEVETMRGENAAYRVGLDELNSWDGILDARDERVAKYEEEIKALEASVAELKRKIEAEAKERAHDVAAREACKVKLEKAPRHEETLIQAKLEIIAEATTTNRKADENTRYEAQRAKVQELEKATRKLTSQLEALDDERRKKIAETAFPVQGLGFDAQGIVTFNGIPLSQASQAERIRVSVGVGLAAHPELRVLLVRDGSLLDAEAMQQLSDLAKEHDAQLWIERVGDKDAGAVVIEDGMVRDG